MSRYLYILIMWLCSLSASAQTEGYNPNNPPLPNFPQELAKDTTYALVVNSSPYGSGSLNTSGGQYKAGTSVNLRAYNSNNLYFAYWIDDEGNTISTSTSFSYVMPKRDAVVTAVYRYDPTNPAVPVLPDDISNPSFNLKMETKPAGAGSFNTSSTNLKEGESIHLYAYSNSNFYFKHWEDAEGNTVSTAQNFYYSMPAADTKLYAVYEYNPSNPSNPGKNFYDSFTGEVIVDDFTRGNLSSAIYDVTKGNTSNITSITVAGVVNSNDFSIANNYSTCSIVDLSRTSGVSTVPSYCYSGNTHINRLSLPASITGIEYYAFRNATALTELTCYATVPPVLGNNVFLGVTPGLVVYVPASSVELYEQAAGWKDYEANGTIVIMPIMSQVSALEVNLPEECADGRYKNMPLELLNVKSGQKFKYVITDRINYTFNNLIHGTRYVATLKNLSGQVLAKTDTIYMDEENISVTFDLANMKQLRTVKATVLTPDGTDVTSGCTMTWYDAKGTFLSQGASLAAQVSETNVKCTVALPQTLAMEYVLPADSVYEVVEADNNLVCTLAPLPKMQISGRILDVTTLQAVSNANVTVSQTLNGAYSKSFSAKTDNKGAYTMTVFAAPTSVTYASNDYVSQTIELADSVISKEASTLADVNLKPITGATITTNFTYAASVAASIEPEIQNFYSDYNNVAYNIYNETAKKEIGQFNVQYPNIVLLEEVSEGDSLTIVAKSKNGSFKDITTGGRIDSALRMSVAVPVVQWGGVDATFTTTENSMVLGILYDSKGTFVSKYNYGSSTLSIRELKDGEYTLVTMGASDFFGSIYNLEKFSEAGLQQNIDYLVNKVTVKSGIISPLKNVLVPFFDESKFYYTGDNTSFTVNKTSIVAGNYLTLTAKVDFKPIYASSISDVKVSVELPEGTSMVDNSVMVGSSVAYYELNGNTLTIPLDNNVSSDRVRFCVIPTQSGSFAPNATVQFALNDKKVEQPIGSVGFNVKDVAINVPSEINSPEITITGNASGGAEVVVYADGEVIGITKALANGYWTLTTEFQQPYNLHEYNINAVINTVTGLSVNTENNKCIYNKDKVVAKSVEMTFFNAWMKKNISVTFDLAKGIASDNSYSFYHATDFTFTVDLSNNDTNIVKGVTIAVYTDHNNWEYLEASYNAKMNRWIAVHKFDTGNLPIGVKVDVLSTGEAVVDARETDKIYDSLFGYQKTVLDSQNRLNELFKMLDEEEGKEDSDEERVNAINDQIYELLGLEPSRGSVDELMTDEEFELLIKENDELLSNEYSSIMDGFATMDFDHLNEISEYMVGYEISKASMLDPSALIDEGYIKIEKTDGGFLYCKTTEEICSFVDFEKDIVISVNINNVQDVMNARGRAGTFFSLLQNYQSNLRKEIDKWRNRISDFCEVVEKIHDAVDIPYQKALKDWIKIDKEYNILRQLEVRSQLTPKQALRFAFVKAQRESLTKLVNGWGYAKRFLAEAKVGKIVGCAGSLFSIIDNYTSWLGDMDTFISLYQTINDCHTSYEDDNMRSDIKNFAIGSCVYYLATITSDVASLVSAIAGTEAAPVTMGASLTAVGLALGKVLLNGIASKIYDDKLNNLKNGVSAFNRAFKCKSCTCDNPGNSEPCICLTGTCDLGHKVKCGCAKCNECKCKDGGPCTCNGDCHCDDDDDDDDDPCPICGNIPCTCKCPICGYYPCICDRCPVCKMKPCVCKKCKKCGNKPCTCPPEPIIPPILDPSGYVYEGVSSNRLQGVTATAYYKELVEDMYGDLHENIVLWDAEEYAQRNPLFTDENGMYQWDVPQGLWQVRFEKEGYVPTQSEWLPVPPPQMDVNIGMVQNAQPEVVNARAYEDGVEIEFSKYMNMETLNSDNIYLKVVNGEDESLITDAEIQMMNKEAAIEGSTTEFASKMKLATDQLGYYDEAYLIVSTGVNSYAGIPMAHTFEQKLDVEKKVRELLVDAELNVEYDGQKQIIIAAIPAEAAVGKKLSVVSASDMIATTDVQEVTFDADGQATFTISGELYGATAINYSLVDADLKATSLINVVDPKLLEAVKNPIASRINGTAVYRGQTVTLSCETEGAAIYYTVDGSCPCDEAKRVKYERPIAINDAMTIKFMAVGPNFDESDVVECTYSIRQSDVKLNLAKGWNWNSHDVASPVSVSDLSGVASRILTQTDEAIDDPVFGFVGTLTTIDGSETMKIEAKDAATKSFVGEQYNPTKSTINLVEGWNWLGYPLSQSMTLIDALSYLDVEDGDVISNIEQGFATYTNGEWVGDLQTLNAGNGYLYKSMSSKSFVYNVVPTVANARALHVQRLAVANNPWSVNRHQYPNLMPVIAQVCGTDDVVSDSVYYVAAFVGDECRGVAKFEDEALFLSVYGNEAADVKFKAFNIHTGAMYDLTETLTFSADMAGSVQNPVKLHLGMENTGIHTITAPSPVNGIYTINGVKLNKAARPGFYIMKGTDANGNTQMMKQYIK